MRSSAYRHALDRLPRRVVASRPIRAGARLSACARWLRCAAACRSNGSFICDRSLRVSTSTSGPRRPAPPACARAARAPACGSSAIACCTRAPCRHRNAPTAGRRRRRRCRSVSGSSKARHPAAGDSARGDRGGSRSGRRPLRRRRAAWKPDSAQGCAVRSAAVAALRCRGRGRRTVIAVARGRAAGASSTRRGVAGRGIDPACFAACRAPRRSTPPLLPRAANAVSSARLVAPTAAATAAAATAPAFALASPASAGPSPDRDRVDEVGRRDRPGPRLGSGSCSRGGPRAARGPLRLAARLGARCARRGRAGALLARARRAVARPGVASRAPATPRRCARHHVPRRRRAVALTGASVALATARLALATVRPRSTVASPPRPPRPPPPPRSPRSPRRPSRPRCSRRAPCAPARRPGARRSVATAVALRPLLPNSFFSQALKPPCAGRAAGADAGAVAAIGAGTGAGARLGRLRWRHRRRLVGQDALDHRLLLGLGSSRGA